MGAKRLLGATFWAWLALRSGPWNTNGAGLKDRVVIGLWSLSLAHWQVFHEKIGRASCRERV